MSEKHLNNTSAAKWTPEQDAFLRSHVETNDMSYASIVARLNEKFETSYSRNAAIGRAGRMGLINPFKVKKAKPTGGKEKNRTRPRTKPRLAIIPNGPYSSRLFMSSENVAELKLRCVEIVPRNLSLMDLEPNDCRYPYGEGPFTYCGHPKAEGSSYCGSHHYLTRAARMNITADDRARRAAHARRISRDYWSKLNAAKSTANPDWAEA